MRKHIQRNIEIYVIIGLIMLVFALSIGLAVGNEYLNANSMRKLGYEVKVVNLDCYAKYKERWLTCKTVATNQLELK